MNNTEKILAEFDEKFSLPPEIGDATGTAEYPPKRRPTFDHYEEVKDFLSTSIAQSIAEERERVVGIVIDENYELEEWYISSLRPDALTPFEANQRNMKTRNKIEQLILSPQDINNKE